MKKNKIVTGLSLIIFGAACGWGVAHAESKTSTHDQKTNAEQVKSQNKRQKLPHADRKEAAVRLKATHKQQHQQKLVESAQLEKGYTGNGQRGEQ